MMQATTTRRPMNRADRRATNKAMAKESTVFPETLVEIPRDEWPAMQRSAHFSNLSRVLRSRKFLVQVYDAPAPTCARLSVIRTALAGKTWADGIPWEDMQRLKAEAGFGSMDAVEVYPPDRDVVNVAAVRHLWVMAEPLSFAWRAKL